jgi:hypothetical protein
MPGKAGMFSNPAILFCGKCQGKRKGAFLLQDKRIAPYNQADNTVT